MGRGGDRSAAAGHPERRDAAALRAARWPIAGQRGGGGAAGDYGATILTDTLALACRSGPLAGRTPADWPAAWETEDGAFPGPRAYPRYSVGLLEIALLADGADLARLYPLDLARAFNALTDFLRFRLWWRQPERVADALTYGEADLILARGGPTCVRRLPVGPPRASCRCPPRRCRSPSACRAARPTAMSHANSSPQPSVAAQEVLADAGYTPVAELDTPATPDEAAPPAFPLDTAWWRANGAEAFARFAAWLNR